MAMLKRSEAPSKSISKNRSLIILMAVSLVNKNLKATLVNSIEDQPIKKTL
jgi:hypothetical protein